MTPSEALNELNSRARLGMDFGLARMRAVLNALGNPEKRCQFVHVAGTNGKGSVGAMIAGGLRAAGHRVGRFHSPFVFDVLEQIEVAGQAIAPERFALQVSRLLPVLHALEEEHGATTLFETLTLVAFLEFASSCDVAVVEAGLGGALDCTNVVPAPLAAVLTHIGLDHQEVLGQTVHEIATHKAGIIKVGSRVFVGATNAEALVVIRARAEMHGTPLVLVDASNFSSDADGLNIHLPGFLCRGLRPGLRGPFQHANIALAAATLVGLRDVLPVGDAAIREALENTRLLGRYDARVYAPTQQPVVLDVAHNPDGARALLGALQQDFPGQRLRFVVGMSVGHDPATFLPVLAPVVQDLCVVQPTHLPRPLQDLLGVAQGLGVPLRATGGVQEALLGTRSVLPVVVTGSFYTLRDLGAQNVQVLW